MAGRAQGKTAKGKAAARWAIATRRRAVSLLMDRGRTQEEIAEELGVSEATVSRDVREIEEGLRGLAGLTLLEKVAREEEALVGEEMAFLEEIGEAKSVSARQRVYDTVLQIRRRRAELLGLDAQQRRKMKEVEREASELEELLARLDADG